MAESVTMGLTTSGAEAVVAEIGRLRGALDEIAASGCGCSGYYRCGSCVDRKQRIAEVVLDAGRRWMELREVVRLLTDVATISEPLEPGHCSQPPGDESMIDPEGYVRVIVERDDGVVIFDGPMPVTGVGQFKMPPTDKLRTYTVSVSSLASSGAASASG